MNASATTPTRGFTLIETVIAIGVLAVLLTGFMLVFTPAAAGIKQAITTQDADRLTSTVEQELVTLRTGDTATTGFEKAFTRIQQSTVQATALVAYQYRGNLASIRSDGTPAPIASITGKVAGTDYVIQTMVRRASDDLFKNTTSGDVTAIEGGLYLVKCTQLVFKNNTLTLGTAGTISDLKGAGSYTAVNYPEAVIPFAADFYNVPSKSAVYISSPAFDTFFSKAKTPAFTRNLAVRR